MSYHISFSTSKLPTSSGGGGGTGLYDGVVKVSGNLLVNSTNKALMLRGANVGQINTAPIQGWSPSDPNGGQMPVISALQSWKFNAVRITMNEAAFLCNPQNGVVSNLRWDSAGVMHIPDPGSNYRSTLLNMISQFQAGAMYSIIDVHWTSPANIAPMGQDSLPNVCNTLDYWYQVAQFLQGNTSVVLELFNEPYPDLNYGGTLTPGGSPVNLWQLTMQGGTATQALCWSPTYTTYQILTLSSYTGVFFPGDTITQGAVSATVKAFDSGGQITGFGSITGGTGYTNGTYYPTLTATNGSFAANAVAKIVVSGGAVTSCVVIVPGHWYQTNDTLTASIPGGSGFSVPVASVSPAVVYYSGLSGGTFTTGTVTKTTGKGPMTRLSTSTPVYTSSGTASNVIGNSTNFNNTWRSGGSDTQPWVAFDIHTPVGAGTKNLLIQILNQTYEYNPSADGGYSPWLPTPVAGALTLAQTLATNMPNGATTGNLSAPWPYFSGTYSTTFQNAGNQAVNVTYTQGSTTIQLAAALTSATTATGLTLSNTGNPFYNAPGSYQIQTNTAAGGGSSAPTTGWTTVHTIYQQRFTQAQHLLSVTASNQINWIRILFTACLGSSQNNNISANIDLWDATYGATDGAVFSGDSITANCMDQGNPGITCPSFMDMCNTGGFISTFGTITGGSGGTTGTYNNVALTGGSGANGTANVTVSGGAVTAIAIANYGTGYKAGDVVSVASANIGSTTGFSVPIATVQAAGYYASAFPPQLNGGMPFWTLENYQQVLPQWLALFPGRHVPMPLGTNNLPNYPPNGNDLTATFKADFISAIAIVQSYGKIPIIPTIPYTGDTQHNAGLTPYNNVIAQLQALPGVIAGPDLYTLLLNNKAAWFTNATDLHPNSAGQAGMRTAWAKFFCTLTNTATGTVSNANGTWATAGHQQMCNAVRAAGNNQPVLISGLAYNDDLSLMSTNVITDSAGQLAISWHPYPMQAAATAVSIATAGTGYKAGDTITFPQTPNTTYYPLIVSVTSVNGGAVTGISIATDSFGQQGGRYLQKTSAGSVLPSNPISQASTSGSGTGFQVNVTAWQTVSEGWSDPANRPTVVSLLATYPLVITETGEHSYVGLVGSPWITDITTWADQNKISGMFFWEWLLTAYNPGDNVMITDSTGTPSPGQGVVEKSWTVNHT